MGAQVFCEFSRVKGQAVADAFKDAVDEAQYDSGHGGYTGTIAEKRSFVMVTETPMSSDEADELAMQLIDKSDPRIDDKWGPAGAIPLVDGRWLFFGWASC